MMMALGVREWESELMAQLNELLPPPPTPVTTPAASRSSGNAAAERLDVSTVHGCSVDEQAPAGGRRRCRGSCKRARRHHHHHHHELLPGGGGGGGADANPPCSKRIRRTKEGVIKVETLTMPDFNGYQWRKYGQKQIEGAKYSRNYYRCTNSTDQGCPAKRTVQRDGDGDGDPPKYTVVHIGEHTCKAVDPVAPVILETTVRTSTNATAAVAHAGDVAVSSADTATTSLSSGSPSSTAGTQSPAISSGGNSVDVDDRYCCPYAVGDWFPATPPAPAADPLLVEMDLPIRSPVHLVADEWSMNELLIDDPTNIPSNWRYLFGF